MDGEDMTLKELREKYAWSVEDLAGIAEVDQGIITAVERGEAINWSLAARIKVKVRNYLGNQAIDGLEIPEKSH